MSIQPLKKQDIINVIEGRGCAERIPLLYHMWISSGAFTGEKRAAVERILAEYPTDVQAIDLRIQV